jgi:hypothetical protein
MKIYFAFVAVLISGFSWADACSPQAARGAGQTDAALNAVERRTWPKCSGSYSLTSYKKDYLGGVQEYKVANCSATKAKALGSSDGSARMVHRPSLVGLQVCLLDAQFRPGIEDSYLKSFQDALCKTSQAQVLGMEDSSWGKPQKSQEDWALLCPTDTDDLVAAYADAFAKDQQSRCTLAAALEAGILDGSRNSTQSLASLKACPADQQKSLIEAYQQGLAQRSQSNASGPVFFERARDNSFHRNTMVRGNERLEAFCILNESWGVASVVLLNVSRRARTLGADLEIEFSRSGKVLRRGVLDAWRRGRSIPAQDSLYFEIQAPDGAQSCRIL